MALYMAHRIDRRDWFLGPARESRQAVERLLAIADALSQQQDHGMSDHALAVARGDAERLTRSGLGTFLAALDLRPDASPRAEVARALCAWARIGSITERWP
jgi:hypothetical protein